MAKFWRFVIGTMLVLALTNVLYALCSGVRLQTMDITASLAGCFTALLCVLPRQTFGSVHSRTLIFWNVYLCLWPLFTLIYADAPFWRSAGSQFLLWVIWLAAVVYGRNATSRQLRHLLRIAFGVSLIGVVISLISPESFQSAAAAAGAVVNYGGRGFGFFLQPNEAALSLVWMASLWIALAADTPLTRMMGVAALLVGVLATASRAGFVLLILLAVWLVVTERSRGITLAHRVVLATATAAMVCAAVLALLSAVKQGSLESWNRPSAMLTRLNQIATFSAADSAAGVGSVEERRLAQQRGLVLLGERPWLGYGVGAEVALLQQGRMHLTCHNEFLHAALEGGILRAIALAALPVALWFHPNRRRLERQAHFGIVGFWCVGILVAAFVSGTIFGSRAFCCCLGLLLGRLERCGPEQHRPTVGN